MKPIARENYRIVQLKALRRSRLQLKYINGVWVEADLRDLAERGGTLAKLAEDEFFGRAHIREHGMYVDWPNGTALDAETLWERGKRIIGEDELAAPEGQKVKHPGSRPGVGQLPPER